MKVQKFKLLLIVVNLTCFNSILFSQINVDSIILSSISLKIDSFKKTRATVLRETELFQSVSRSFCFLQEKDKDLAEELFDISLRFNFLPKEVTNSFFVRQYNCFDEKQIITLKRILKDELKPEDPHFFELVSMYGLSNFNDFFKNNLVSSDLKGTLEIELTSQRKLSKNATLELKSLATLANLGHPEIEEDLIRIVVSIWEEYSENPKWNGRVVSDIFYNSIPLLLSKRSVIETIFMLDQPSIQNNPEFFDIAAVDPGFHYFLACIQPKLNTYKLEDLGWIDFQKNKTNIKNTILEDDSIWLDYIR